MLTFITTEKKQKAIPYAMLDAMDWFFIYTNEDDPDEIGRLYFLNLGDNNVYSLDEQEITTFDNTDLVYIVPDSAVTITIEE